MPIQTAQHITGAAVADISHRGTSALPVAPRPRFDYYFVPGAYTIMGGKVRPQLKQFLHQAGVDNVEQLPDGRISVVGAQADKVAKKGAVFLGAAHCPAEMTPDGQPGYLRRYQGNGGSVYVAAWERPVLRGTRVIWTHDEEGFRAWLDYLMATGVVPYPDEAVIGDLMDRAQYIRGAVESRRDKGASIEEAAARADAQIAALEAAKGTPKAAPAKRPRGKVAADG
jgi:hypothetical protein